MGHVTWKPTISPWTFMGYDSPPSFEWVFLKNDGVTPTRMGISLIYHDISLTFCDISWEILNKI